MTQHKFADAQRGLLSVQGTFHISEQKCWIASIKELCADIIVEGQVEPSLKQRLIKFCDQFVFLSDKSKFLL